MKESKNEILSYKLIWKLAISLVPTCPKVLPKPHKNTHNIKTHNEQNKNDKKMYF